MQNRPLKTMNVCKPFRLIDFHMYDGTSSQMRGTTSNTGSASDESLGSDGSLGSSDKGSTEPHVFAIQMFGVNEQGQTASITIDDFRPFFFVRVGDQWTQGTVGTFMEALYRRMNQPWFKKQVVSAHIVQYHKLYGFSAGKKDKFVQITLTNQNAFTKLKNLWYYNDRANNRRLGKIPFQGTETEIYESSIPPLLRYFHINNISPSGWVMVYTNRAFKPKPDRKTTSCDFEYVCSYKHIVPMPEKETIVPYKIMSFDIEASSSHGDFPVPIKTYKKLAQNVVDAYLSQPKMDKDRANLLTRKVVMSAFGYDRFDDVDVVYPKRAPTKSDIQNRLNIFLSTPVEKAKKIGAMENEDGADRASLLSIVSYFSSIESKLDSKSYRNSASDDEDDDEPCSDDDISNIPKYSPKKLDILVVDILLSDKLTRDEKIQVLDETMTMLFPPLKGDEATFIGSTFLCYGEKEPYLNHCFVVGSCDPVPGATIESCDTERDMLVQWKDLVLKENPDIVIGYNIFGFDYEFLFRRSQETRCDQEFLAISRRIGDVCLKEKFGKTTKDGPSEIESTKVALASGEYDLRYIKMAGRLQVDLYMYLRREFTNFASYKLDNMASSFISDDIKHVEVVHDTQTVTRLFSKNLAGLHIGDYIHIEIVGFSTDHYADGKKFAVLNIEKDIIMVDSTKYNVITIAGDYGELAVQKNIRWGMAKDDVSPQDIFLLTRGSAADRAKVAKYCIQDCNLVHHLFSKVDVFTGYIEMSRICSVPISFLVLRGQGIKLTSYVAKKCRDKQTLMPDLEKSGANEGYEGAIVLPPKCSMYMDNPVACVDYASLYPSSMISQNFSHDTKVWTKEYDLVGNLIRETGEHEYDNLPNTQYIDIEFDTYTYIRKSATAKAVKTVTGKKVCRWAQQDVDTKKGKGIMPSILEELLKARSDTRKQAKKETDPFMQNILDKRQLGYKVTANSLYGQCGAKTSTFYEQDVAASTTATGRMMITYARRIIEEVYGDMVYNTESHGPVLTKAEYVYGDSVAKWTPVYLRIHHKKDGKTNCYYDICEVSAVATKYGHGNWLKCAEPGKQEKEYCAIEGVDTWTEKGWTPLKTLIRHGLAQHKSMVRVQTKHGIVDVTDDHSLIDHRGNKVSPQDIHVDKTKLLTSWPKISYRKLISNQTTHNKTRRYDDEYDDERYYDTQVEAATELCRLRERSWFWSSNYRVIRHFTGAWYIECNTSGCISTYKDKSSVVKKMDIIPYHVGDYVYDLTTGNHHFSAGIGNIVVHNTDSVFFTFNLQDAKTGEPIRGQKALEMTIEIAQDAAHLCTRYLKPPMELSYEKTLMPFILLKKKRYVGMLYETNPKKGKLKFMGLALKRRDSCDYVKDVYGGILSILMFENNLAKSMDFLNVCLENLVKGNVPIDKLLLTRALGSYYKNPRQIAHAVLADRMGKRDPGNKPKPGDRIKYLYFNNPEASLQGDKIETPEHIAANRLKVDYAHYITNQLMSPIQQLYGLALEQIWELQKKPAAIKKHRQEIAELEQKWPDLEELVNRKDTFCSKKVKPLLFDKWLTQINNEKNRMQPISNFFIKK
jgi:DNA polymerase elongation subunit (family B)